MARRSDHNREELYKMALAAAQEIVKKEGFRGLTARKVADHIGYSAGTLYNLFKNLDEMALHVNAGTLGLLQENLSETPLTGQPEQDIKALLDRYLGFIQSHDRLWSMLFEHKLPESMSLPDWYQVKVDEVLTLLEAALAPLYGPGQDQDKALAARVLWSSLHGICQLAAASKLDIVSEETTRALANNLVEIYVAGVRAGSN